MRRASVYAICALVRRVRNGGGQYVGCTRTRARAMLLQVINKPLISNLPFKYITMPALRPVQVKTHENKKTECRADGPRFNIRAH